MRAIANADSYSNAYSYRDSHANGNCHAYRYGNANTHADAVHREMCTDAKASPDPAASRWT